MNFLWHPGPLGHLLIASAAATWLLDGLRVADSGERRSGAADSGERRAGPEPRGGRGTPGRARGARRGDPRDASAGSPTFPAVDVWVAKFAKSRHVFYPPGLAPQGLCKPEKMDPAILGRASRVLLPERSQDRSQTSDRTRRRGGRCLRRRGPRVDRGAATGRRGDPRSRRDVRVGARGPVRGAVAGARGPTDGRRDAGSGGFSDCLGKACPGLHDLSTASRDFAKAVTNKSPRVARVRAPHARRRASVVHGLTTSLAGPQFRARLA